MSQSPKPGPSPSPKPDTETETETDTDQDGSLSTPQSRNLYAKRSPAYRDLPVRQPHHPRLEARSSPFEVGPEFAVTVSNPQTLSKGYLVFSFPQPLDTPTPQATAVLWDPTENHNQHLTVHVRAPRDRYNNCMEVEFYEFGASGTLSRQAAGFVYVASAMRQAGLRTREKPSRGQTVTVDLMHVHQRTDTPHRVLALRLDAVHWPGRGDESATHVSLLKLRQDVNVDFHNQFEVRIQPRTRKVLHHYMSTMRQWIEPVRCAVQHLPAWKTVSESFCCATLPLWAMLVEYAHPPTRAHDLESLDRLVKVSAAMLGLDLTRSSRLTQEQLSELLGDTMTLLSLCQTYAPDRRHVLKGKDASHLQVTDRYVQEDQWVHSLDSPDLARTEYDCEDGAALAFYVCRLLQTSPLQNLDTVLGQVQVHSRKFHCFVAIGSLQTGPDSYTYHAFPVLAPRQDVHNKLQADLETGFLGAPDGYSSSGLKTMFVETTESTTCCPDYQRGYSEKDFTRVRLADPHVHCKIPRRCMRSSAQYQYVIQMLCPQLFDSHGLTDFYCLEAETGSLGAQGGSVQPSFDTKDWKAFVALRTSPEVYDAVRLCVSQLRRTRGLPVRPSEPAGLPVFSPENGQVLMYCNSLYGSQVRKALMEQTSQTYKHTTAYHDVEVVDGLHVDWFVVTPEDHAVPNVPLPVLKGAPPQSQTDEEVAAGLQARYQERHRAITRYPVGGIYNYHRKHKHRGHTAPGGPTHHELAW